MSVAYRSPTHSWNSDSNAFSYYNEHSSAENTYSHITQEFMNAIQAKKNYLDQTTLFNYSNENPLETMLGHDLSLLLNTTRLLLIDVRSGAHYSKDHIKSAIHITIPSILLKRPSYTIERVTESLKDVDHIDRFKQWNAATHIVFYDHASKDSRSSATATLLALKFKELNYKGTLAYLQDGFEEFKQSHPDQCHQKGLAIDDTPSSSFFTNIRQNLELSHGPLKERFTIRIPNGNNHQNRTIQSFLSPTHPPPYGQGENYTSHQGNLELPLWIKQMMDAENGPKKLAESYEQLERKEQERLLFIMKYHSSHKSTHFPLSISSSMEKGTLNRYNNIWPYEYSRVKLSNKEDDYINANHMQYATVKDEPGLSHSPLSTLEQDMVQSGLVSQDSLKTMNCSGPLERNRRYIATQCPLPTTFDDFWKMIWDEQSYVIVMLTNEEEVKKAKCHCYWPSSTGVSQTYGSISVTLLSKDVHPVINMNDKRERDDDNYIIVRKFRLCSQFSDRTVTHLQYTGWPDFGVPDHPIGLLQMVRLADELFRADHGEKGPWTVHCSAGCGRTGTFCVVDTVMQRLWRDGCLSSSVDTIKETVGRFREQRMSAVQTHRQYVFCYEAILWSLLGYGHLPSLKNGKQ